MAEAQSLAMQGIFGQVAVLGTTDGEIRTGAHMCVCPRSSDHNLPAASEAQHRRGLYDLSVLAPRDVSFPTREAEGRAELAEAPHPRGPVTNM